MPGYIIVEIEVADPVRYEAYKAQAEATLARYGGTYLVRGGAAETLEGDWQPRRLVVLRFESVERARAWWTSAEYAAPKALRQETARTRMILVEGL